MAATRGESSNLTLYPTWEHGFREGPAAGRASSRVLRSGLAGRQQKVLRGSNRYAEREREAGALPALGWGWEGMGERKGTQRRPNWLGYGE